MTTGDAPKSDATAAAQPLAPTIAGDLGGRRFGWSRWLLLLLVAAGIALAWAFHGRASLEPALLQRLLVRHPLLALGLFVAMYAAAVIACVPGAPFNLAAGFFWGPLWGGVIATLAASLGSVVAFYLARLLFGQPLARRFDHRIVAAVQQEFDAKGWRFLAFLRLNPIFPTGPLNYLFGLTAIDAAGYGATTLACLFPPSLAVAAIGYEASALWAEGDAARLLRALAVVSAAVTVLVGLKYAAGLLNRRRLS